MINHDTFILPNIILSMISENGRKIDKDTLISSLFMFTSDDIKSSLDYLIYKCLITSYYADDPDNTEFFETTKW